MALLKHELDRFDRAEDALQLGRFGEARDGYAAYLRSRLRSVTGGGPWMAADAIALERLSELCIYLCQEDIATELGEALAQVQQKVGNRYGYLAATIGLAYLRLRRDRLRQSLETLDRLRFWTGDPDTIDVSAAGLARWEQTRDWPASGEGDRAAILAAYFLVLGRLFGANGRYGNALQTLARGEHHAGTEESRMFRDALCFAQVHCLVESGRAEEALRKLEEIGPRAGSPQQLASLELRAQIHWQRGELGRGVACAEEAVAKADSLDLRYAMAATRLQLAQYRVLINKTLDAETSLRQAAELMEHTGAEDLRRRAASVEQLIHLRRKSQAPMAPSVLELQAGGDVPEVPSPTIDDHAPAPATASFLGLVDDRVLEVQQALARGDIPRARGLTANLEPFGESDSPLVAGRIETAHGLVLYCERQYGAAAERFSAAQDVYERSGQWTELRQIHRYEIWCAERLGDNDFSRIHRDAEAALLGCLAASLSARDQTYFWLNKWTQEEEQLSGQLTALARLHRRAASSSGLKGLAHRLRFFWRLTRFLTHVDAYRQHRSRMALVGGSTAPAPPAPHCVKGGVKPDHRGGEKVDQARGIWGFTLRDLRGRLERRPAARVAGRA